MIDTITLIGSPKQQKWAQAIIQELSEQYPDVLLPDNRYAEWWIDHRNLSIEEIIASQEIRSPFTAQFPRYTRADVAAVLCNMGNFAVLDTETSGISKECEIVEIAIVALATGDILLNTIVKPYDLSSYLKSKARDMHTISEEQIEAAPTLPDKWQAIRSMLSQYHPVSYNAAFDFPMIRRSAMKWGLPTPDITATCVMKMFQAYMCSDDYYKLSEACSVMGIDQNAYGIAHTALADTLAACELLKRMRDSL